MGGAHPGKPSTSHTCWDGVGTREEEKGEVGERRGGEENDRLRDLSGVTLSGKSESYCSTNLKFNSSVTDLWLI